MLRHHERRKTEKSKLVHDLILPRSGIELSFDDIDGLIETHKWYLMRIEAKSFTSENIVKVFRSFSFRDIVILQKAQVCLGVIIPVLPDGTRVLWRFDLLHGFDSMTIIVAIALMTLR